MRLRVLIPASALTCATLACALMLPAVPVQSEPAALRPSAPVAAVQTVAYRPLHAAEALPGRQPVDPLAHAAPALPCSCPGCADAAC